MYKTASDSHPQHAQPFGLVPSLPQMWSLMLTSPLTVGQMATEWLAFVHRRWVEDVRLAGQVAAARSPAECWQAYSGFIERAVGDYREEFTEQLRISGHDHAAGDARPLDTSLDIASGVRKAA